MTDTAEPGPAPQALPDVISFRLDGQGGARPIAPDEAAASGLRPDDKGFTWLHMRRDDPGTAGRLAALGLDPAVLEGLTAEETRPRCTVHGEGVLLILRGVNLTPGAEPEDMISVRLWLEGPRIIGIWLRPLHAVGDLLDAIGRGMAPASPGEFVSKLVLRVTDRAEPAVAALNEAVDDLEESLLEPASATSRPAMSRTVLSDIRRRAILLRRYMIPQRDALTTLEIEDLAWLHDRDRSRIREAAERVTRLGEDLDAIRDRAQVIHDQLSEERADRMNQRMLVLSIAAAIFLPLGLITGLLGINVAGIPGAEEPLAFWVVVLALVALGAALYAWFRWLGMFR